VKTPRARILETFGSKPTRTRKLSRGELLVFVLDATTWAVSCGLGRDFDLVTWKRGALPDDAVVQCFEALATRPLKVHQVVRDVTLAGFPMTCALLRDDHLSVFIDDEARPPFAGLKPKRTLLSLMPLHDGEADAIESRGLAAFREVFGRVKWDDPKRKPFAGPAPTRKAPPKARGPWDQLLADLAKRDVLAFDRLVEAKGAKATAVAALKKARPTLHPSVLAHFERFDGGVPLFEYTTLSARLAAARAKSLDSLVRQRRATFPKSLTPFAEDGGGNLLCVDHRGQVVQWEIRGHDTFARAKSLDALVLQHLREVE